ncbi:NFX1-type zinc finger-containing protein 1-like isoform X2 [Chrysoperla carnea]|uniref:NFX1-type zinc finger-containing protein 1-like isoform X2 n=1 Tax=Chrysoperla carnea TaxID=189513 RepID=UPI001D060317|nr:NFX1-type zinc finger-containing protein 1-like isoform X2 [Chrysoperla carnea]
MGGIISSILEIFRPKTKPRSNNIVRHYETNYETKPTFVSESRSKFVTKETFQVLYQNKRVSENELPFGDFRTMRIIPTTNEILGPNETKIRPNIINGKYLSVNHYLDIHFRLLREDFMAPLRDDIQDYKRNSVSKLRIYNVQIVSRLCVEQNRLYFVVKLNLSKNKLKLLQDSKDLCYGSMVILFQKGSFQTMIIGSVSQKDEKTLEDGEIFVEPLNLWDINKYFNKDLIMIEPNSHFESYRYIAEVFQQINEYSFPMSRYILKAEVASQLPGYLTNKICTNILSILLDFSEQVKYDCTQYDAIKAALTNEFCIIQGPPGTGKTFIGLEIIKILLQNHTLWCYNGPILIVCKTNHALDQFLEGILKITHRLARVGGQSKNDKLNEFNIKELRKNFKRNRNRSDSLKSITDQIKILHSKLLDAYTYNREMDWDWNPENNPEKIIARILTLKNQYNAVLQNRDVELLRQYLVVGMTTTGAAKNRRVLEGLRSPIVFVEEAAEVLESHIIISLTTACKHLILIGDHKQLRPSTADYRLAKDCKLDISLFERMILNGMYCATLGVQHRMRPEFAQLIAPSIYPHLRNHQSVYAFPSIMGMTKNLFFIKHTHLEQVLDSVSKQNNHEANFLLQLCRYLILQGYSANEVTILTTYNGQVQRMKKLQKSIPTIDNVRITSVDNFQGEECNIILLSLVRSNGKGEIGFLSADNRICVALSRAKHGFYMIGNMNILVKHTKSKWPEINQVLIDNKSIGTDLVLQCQIHKDQRTKVNCGDNFKVKCPEGGCLLRCNTTMPCGHVCERVCHVQDRAHIKIICKKPCLRQICPQNKHQCQELCYKKCSKCICYKNRFEYGGSRRIIYVS